MIAAQIFCAFYLTGVIWLIQLIHYPAFAMIDPAAFGPFHAHHSRVMTVLVGPVMILELVSAAWLARGFETRWLANLTSVIIPFASTFLLSVPLHSRLEIGCDTAACASLVRTNWIRTALWTARSLAFVYYLLRAGSF